LKVYLKIYKRLAIFLSVGVLFEPFGWQLIEQP